MKWCVKLDNGLLELNIQRSILHLQLVIYKSTEVRSMFYSLWLRSERKPIHWSFLIWKEELDKGTLPYKAPFAIWSTKISNWPGRQWPSSQCTWLFSVIFTQPAGSFSKPPAHPDFLFLLLWSHCPPPKTLEIHQTNLVLNALPFAVPSPRCPYPPCLISIRVLSSVYLLSET